MSEVRHSTIIWYFLWNYAYMGYCSTWGQALINSKFYQSSCISFMKCIYYNTAWVIQTILHNHLSSLLLPYAQWDYLFHLKFHEYQTRISIESHREHSLRVISFSTRYLLFSVLGGNEVSFYRPRGIWCNKLSLLGHIMPVASHALPNIHLHCFVYDMHIMYTSQQPHSHSNQS